MPTGAAPLIPSPARFILVAINSVCPMLRLLALAAALLVAAPALAQPVTLRTGRTIEASIAVEGERDAYAFTASTDWFVTGWVDQRSVDVEIVIAGPDGKELAKFDGPARGRESFTLTTTADGVHTVSVHAAGNADPKTGAYAITLQRAEPVATDPKKRTDQLLSPWNRTDAPGAAVHVFQGGRTLYATAVGLADLAAGTRFTVDSPTNIGSTSKQFTAFAVLLLAEEGKLSLDDDVRKHVPELPDLGSTVTIRHILNHTSGYREFLNLLLMSGRDLGNGDWIRRGEVIDIIRRQPKLQNEPGAEWNYNNSAFSLAATIVERVSGQPFADFLRDRVFVPLGMTHTLVRPTPEHVVPGRTVGYVPAPDGGWLEKRDIGASTGAGGIYASVLDLKKWVENYENPRVGNARIVEQMTTSFVLANGDTTGYGLGLFIDKQNGVRRVQHGGADIAHRSMLAWYPDLDAGITVQSNDGSFNANLAFTIAEAFFPQLKKPETPASQLPGAFDPATYDPAAFDAYVGRYSLDVAPDFILSFFREEGTFYTQATGQPRAEIRPTSDSTFALTIVEASVTFHRDKDGKVTSLTLHQNGNNRATRLPEEGEAAAAKPAPPRLADFVGRYLSDELETFFTLVEVDSALVLQQRRMDDLKLTHTKDDTFASTAFPDVTFERDRNGRVIAFYLANGRTRDVRFRRLD